MPESEDGGGLAEGQQVLLFEADALQLPAGRYAEGGREKDGRRVLSGQARHPEGDGGLRP